MKRVSLLFATSLCAFGLTSSAFAAETSAEAATESVDPAVSGVLPEGAGASESNPAEDSDADLDEASSGDTREAKNAIYLDLAGPGVLYSLNYDRVIIKDLSARIGFSYMSMGASSSDSTGTASASVSASYLAIPITASYLGLGSESNMFEVGGGGVIMNLSGDVGVVAADDEESAEASVTTVALTALAGYRHQPADGGFVFRIGASPMMIPGAGFLPWGYLSLGAAF